MRPPLGNPFTAKLPVPQVETEVGGNLECICTNIINNTYYTSTLFVKAGCYGKLYFFDTFTFSKKNTYAFLEG